MDVSGIPGEATYFKSAGGAYVSVERDLYPVSPRGYGEGMATFYTWTSAPSIDENPYPTPDAFVDDALGEGASARCRSMQDVMRAFRARGYVIEGVYRPRANEGAYAVGETNPYADDPRSAPCGFAFASPADMADANLTHDGAREAMRREIEAYSAYAQGNVWRVREFDARSADLARSRPFYGLDAVERAYPFVEPIPVRGDDELATYARLVTEWEHIPAREGDPREAYAKGDAAIVSDGAAWRLMGIHAQAVSVETYASAHEALAAFEGYCSLSRALGPEPEVSARAEGERGCARGERGL